MRWLLNTRNSVGPPAAAGSGVTRGLGGAGVERAGRGGGGGAVGAERRGSADMPPDGGGGGAAGSGVLARWRDGGGMLGPFEPGAPGGGTCGKFCDEGLAPAW